MPLSTVCKSTIAGIKQPISVEYSYLELSHYVLKLLIKIYSFWKLFLLLHIIPNLQTTINLCKYATRITSYL